MESNQEFKYIVYKTTNKINGKFYIGVHKTKDPSVFDGYYGNGIKTRNDQVEVTGDTPLRRAFAKYGAKSFERSTLMIFNNADDAYDLERWLITEDFISNKNNYNAAVGGVGGIYITKKRTVYQFDLNGNFVGEWDTETSIREHFNSHVSIIDIINKKRNFAGYYWSFEKEINVLVYNPSVKGGFINQYDKDGMFVAQYRSMFDAANILKINPDLLRQIVFRKRLYQGYYYLKTNVNIQDVLSGKTKRRVKKRPVFRYLLNGTFDKKYETVSDAIRDVRMTNQTLAKRIRSGEPYKGYYWSFFCTDKYDKSKCKESPIPKIEQYTKDGTLVKIWDNHKDCLKEFPYYFDVCNGKSKSHKGYVFKYQD